MSEQRAEGQLHDLRAPRLTIGQLLLPVVPFVIVLAAQSFVFLDHHMQDESESVTPTIEFQLRFGPCLLSSSTATIHSLVEQTQASTVEEIYAGLFKRMSIKLDRARSLFAVCLFPIALAAWVVIGRSLQWHSRVIVPSSRVYAPFKTVGACMGILCTLVISVALMKAFWPPSVSELVRHFGLRAGAITLIHMVIVAPVAEELVFRSFLCRTLVERIGPVAGIFLQALIFGSFHLVSPAHAAVAFTGGIILGTVYVYTRSLGAAIFLHAASNALLVGTCLAIA